MNSNPTKLAVQLRSGWRQARIELRTQLRSGAVISYVILPLAAIVFMQFGNTTGMANTGITMAKFVIPSLLAAGVFIGGFIGPSMELPAEREDGSLARMRIVPGGLGGYVFGKVITMVTTNLASVLLTFGVMAVMLPELLPGSLSGWALFLFFLVLGLLATTSLGLTVGSLTKSTSHLFLVVLLGYAILICSGTFFPINGFPSAVKWLIMAFPLYWLALGLRSVFLPTEALALEIGNSWFTLESIAVLGAWAIVGLLLAPILLRRMARGVSGSTVAAARERMLARGY